MVLGLAGGLVFLSGLQKPSGFGQCRDGDQGGGIDTLTSMHVHSLIMASELWDVIDPEWSVYQRSKTRIPDV